MIDRGVSPWVATPGTAPHTAGAGPPYGGTQRELGDGQTRRPRPDDGGGGGVGGHPQIKKKRCLHLSMVGKRADVSEVLFTQ